MRVVDLGFISRAWPATLLKLGVKIDPGVRPFHSHDLKLELKILEGAAVYLPSVVKVTARPEQDDLAVFDLTGLLVLVGGPTGQVLAVEKVDPLWNVRRPDGNTRSDQDG